jgi:hypothetical protein
MTVKYSMNYKLYTLVDITHTGQYRHEPGKERQWQQEQNFNTVIHTLGLRSNIFYNGGSQLLEVKGSLVGFDTDDILRVWRFDWTTEADYYTMDNDPLGFLKQDFHLVPYIGNLGESMTQTHRVFNTQDPGKNIVFHLRE